MTAEWFLSYKDVTFFSTPCLFISFSKGITEFGNEYSSNSNCKRGMIMRRVKPKILALAVSLALASFSPATLAAAEHSIYESRLSANIPLNSNVYDQLEKLDGLGYIQSMRTGAKPYTRMQAAGWIKEASSQVSSADASYVHTILAELKQEFRNELSVLDGGTTTYGLALKEWSAGFSRYDGAMLDQNRTNSSYQPFAVNSDGYRLDDDGNFSAAIRLEGKVAPSLVASLTMRGDSDLEDNLTFPSTYIKTHINNMEIQVGKDSLSWGQGNRSSLLLTNNSTPRRAIKLSTIKPLDTGGIFKFLGQISATGFYSELEDDRGDVDQPSFTGVRVDFVPSDRFTFGIARTDMVGGKGHALHGSDYGDWLFGKNASSASIDLWNSLAGLDFRWRLNTLRGAQVYGELYGEDQAGSLPPLPRDNAYLLGIYLPRVSPSGDWDAHLEWSDTSPSWYDHSLYQDGYTYKGNIMGDAMGNNAYRYYGKLTHYLDNATQISLHGERVVMSEDLTNPQTVNSVWASLRTKVGQDMFVDAALGKARVSQAGTKDNGVFTSLQISQKF
jgi:hypothetical protein